MYLGAISPVMSKKQLKFLLPRGVHTIALGLGDLHGVMRGKRVSSDRWSDVCDSGVALCLSTFAMDATCDVFQTSSIGFSTGYPDFHIHPLSRPVLVPWESGVAVCMGRSSNIDGTDVSLDPRLVLMRQVARATELGYRVEVGCELEFYLLDPDTLLPRDSGIQVYGLDRASELEHVLGPIRRQINEMGILVEQSNPEYAAGQVEVNLRYCEALEAADRVIMFRSLVKQLSRHHGYLATFMSKPFYDYSGSGFHTHYSLWRNKKNVFASGKKLSRIGSHFLGGLQRRMCEMSILSSMTPNSYRRRQPLSFCPVNATWGLDNRTTGLRVIEGSSSSTRIEKRDGASDCNPYLLLAAEICAGLDGIESGVSPSRRTDGNAYLDDSSSVLPRTLGDALCLARGSSWLKRLLGKDLYELILLYCEREIEIIGSQVTPLERDRYLKNF